jgi:hypothetical protein
MLPPARPPITAPAHPPWPRQRERRPALVVRCVGTDHSRGMGKDPPPRRAEPQDDSSRLPRVPPSAQPSPRPPLARHYAVCLRAPRRIFETWRGQRLAACRAPSGRRPDAPRHVGPPPIVRGRSHAPRKAPSGAIASGSGLRAEPHLRAPLRPALPHTSLARRRWRAAAWPRPAALGRGQRGRASTGPPAPPAPRRAAGRHGSPGRVRGRPSSRALTGPSRPRRLRRRDSARPPASHCRSATLRD